jgi:hypothetical protein
VESGEQARRRRAGSRGPRLRVAHSSRTLCAQFLYERESPSCIV